MKSKLSVWTAMLLLPAALAWAEDKSTASDETTKILEKVDAAAKAVQGVKYDVVVKASVRGQGFELKGRYIFSGLEGRNPKKFVADIEVTPPGSTESLKYTGGSDGDTYYVIDHANKKAYVDIDPEVLGRNFGRMYNAGLMLEFVYPTPFADELKAESKTMKGTKTIGGVECYEIEIAYTGADGPKATWCFSKKDFLPRKRVDHSPRGKSEKTITNLVVDPKIDDATFHFKLPKGYTQIDDFAP